MLYHFFDHALFTFVSTRIIGAALTAFILTVFLGKPFIEHLRRKKVERIDKRSDMLDSLQKGKKATPLWGGVLVLGSTLFSLLLWMNLTSSYTLILCVTTLFFSFLGGLDDWMKQKHDNSKGISARLKLAGQTLFVVGISLYLYLPGAAEKIHAGKWFSPPKAKIVSVEGDIDTLSTDEIHHQYYVPLRSKPILFAFPALITFFVIVGSSNAVNLTDGLDGLASGCVILCSLVFLGLAFVSNNIELARTLHLPYLEGSGEIAVFMGALIGALLGFLVYNGYPAQIFMGDMCSLTLGALLGVSAVLLRKEVLLAIAGGIFVMEALSVILQVGSFRLRGKRIFRCAPFHHHFQFGGIPESKVVLRFWIAGLILALIAAATVKFQ